MKAQEKIRNANILLITMKALANEVAKNLVLAGVGSLTIIDHEVVTAADLGAQFLLSADRDHLGANRAAAALPALQRLNPRVAVHADLADIRSKGPSYFSPFDIVIATDLDPSTLNVINTATRVNNVAFYAAGSYGLYGFIFADLIEHDYAIERQWANLPTGLGQESRTRSVLSIVPKPDDHTRELVTKRELYSTWFLASDGSGLPTEITRSPRRRRAVTPALSCLRALWDFVQMQDHPPSHSREDLTQFTMLVNEKHRALGLPPETLRSEFLRSFMQNIGAEIAPVTAVLGGQLAQDVINVLGQNQQPIQNMVIFDGNTMDAHMYSLHPEGDLGAKLLTLSTPAPTVPPVPTFTGHFHTTFPTPDPTPVDVPQQEA